jgi:hypothetical protein
MSLVAPTAGWYVDPANPHAQRWWDGRQWTPYVHPPLGGAPSEGSSPHDALHWIVPVGRSWQAIAAGYAGLISLFAWPLGPIAIGLGLWALAVASKKSTHGRGRAWFGIIAGLFGTLVFIYVLGPA